MANETTPLAANGTELKSVNDNAVRNGFIIKVYGILAAQLVLTLVIGGWVMYLMIGDGKSGHDHTKQVALVACLYVASFVVTMCVCCTLCCCPIYMKTYPYNYIILFAFTCAESVVVGVTCSEFTTESVLMALGMTAFIVFGLTIFACTTSIDFTGWGPYVYCGALVLMSVALVLTYASLTDKLTMDTDNRADPKAFTPLHAVGCAGFAILFSFYLVYDTQLIVGGSHKTQQFGLDDYAFAALMLYIDIIEFFLWILEMLGERR